MKAKPDMVARSLGTSSPHKEKEKMKSKKRQRKHEATETTLFSSPVCCTGVMVNAVAEIIANSESTQIVKLAPGPSTEQPGTSAGCESEIKQDPPPGPSPSMPSASAEFEPEPVNSFPDPSSSPSI